MSTAKTKCTKARYENPKNQQVEKKGGLKRKRSHDGIKIKRKQKLMYNSDLHL